MQVLQLYNHKSSHTSANLNISKFSQHVNYTQMQVMIN